MPHARRTRLGCEPLEGRALMAASLSISDAVVREGDGPAPTLMSFTVTLSEVSNTTVTVDYATADKSAKAGPDYWATAGTLTLAPGETSKTIVVQVVGNTRSESHDETFRVNLSKARNASLADAAGIGIIRDNDYKRPMGRG